jgi:hypothetical protein
MDEKTRRARELDAPETIAAELEKLRVLKDRELGVSLEYDRDGAIGTCPTSKSRKVLGRGVLRGGPGVFEGSADAGTEARSQTSSAEGARR